MTDVPIAAGPPAIPSIARPKATAGWTAVLEPNEIVRDRTMIILTVGWILGLLLLWSLARFPLLPTPIEVWKSFVQQWQQGAGHEMISSIWTSLRAIFFASVIGLGLSYASTLPFLKVPVNWISKLRFLSLTGVILIFIMATPNGDALKVSVLTFAIVTFLINDMLQIIEDIPASKFDHARTLGMKRLPVLREVVIRGTLAQAFEAIRMNAAMAWMMLTMVETLSRSGGGIGILLFNLNRHLDLGAIFAIQLMIFVVGICQDRLVKFVKVLVCPNSTRRV